MKNSGSIVYLLVVISAAVWVMACVSSPKTGNPSETRTTIQAIQDHPDRYTGTTVRLTVRFKGWKGACKETPPKTRSDWMIADDTGCIYVTGTLPAGLQPMAPKDEALELTGVVRLTKRGAPYLEVQSP